MRDEPDAIDAARVLALALLGVAGAGFAAEQGLPRPVAAAAQQVLFLVIPLAYARVVGLRPLRSCGFAPLRFRQAFLVLLVALGTMWLLKGVADSQGEFFRGVGLEDTAREEERRIHEGIRAAQRRGVAPALGLLVLLPPLCEETFFRGLLLRGLASRFGAALSVGATALVFASLHGTVVQFVLMTILGILWGALVRLTGSLWSSILAHAVNNLSVVVVTWIFGESLPSLAAPGWMLGLSAGVVGLGLALLAAEQRAHSEPESGSGGTGT
jgi:membrane protease YdiL (CAAX protease family)